MNWSNSTARFKKHSQALFAVTRNGCAVVGLAAISMLALRAADFSQIGMHDALAHQDASAIAEQPALPATPAPTAAAPMPPDPRERPLSKFLARSYRIAPEAAADLVHTSFEVGKIVSLDPVLLLAVMAVESRFNPIAESPSGAKGLMQVIPQYHLDKLGFHGGEEAVLDPWLNIYVGAQILAEYVKRAGSVADGLQWYNGASTDSFKLYAEKVLGEKERLQQVLPRSARAATKV